MFKSLSFRHYAAGGWFLIAALLSACTPIQGLTASQSSVAISTIQACNSYAVGVASVSALVASGKLSKVEAAKVIATEPAANAVCLSKTPPTGSASALQAVNNALVAIVAAQSGAK